MLNSNIRAIHSELFVSSMCWAGQHAALRATGYAAVIPKIYRGGATLGEFRRVTASICAMTAPRACTRREVARTGLIDSACT